jgi:hypothetical protein
MSQSTSSKLHSSLHFELTNIDMATFHAKWRIQQTGITGSNVVHQHKNFACQKNLHKRNIVNEMHFVYALKYTPRFSGHLASAEGYNP